MNKNFLENQSKISLSSIFDINQSKIYGTINEIKVEYDIAQDLMILMGLTKINGSKTHPENESYQFNKMEDFSHFRFELKYFFSSHVSTQDGGEFSSTAIRAIIKRIVAEENIHKPLSDNKITQILEAKGINVARRTIAKYRESLSIPPSNERKRLN